MFCAKWTILVCVLVTLLSMITFSFSDYVDYISYKYIYIYRIVLIKDETDVHCYSEFHACALIRQTLMKHIPNAMIFIYRRCDNCLQKEYRR